MCLAINAAALVAHWLSAPLDQDAMLLGYFLPVVTGPFIASIGLAGVGDRAAVNLHRIDPDVLAGTVRDVTRQLRRRAGRAPGAAGTRAYPGREEQPSGRGFLASPRRPARFATSNRGARLTTRRSTATPAPH
jgi:hypothetical protein